MAPFNYQLVEDTAKELYIRALKILPPDVREALKKAYEKETNPTGKETLKTILKNVEVADKEAALRAVREKYSSGRVTELDGVSVEFPDFWFNVRPSNTEPLLRLRLEARTPQIARAKSEDVRKLIGSV